MNARERYDLPTVFVADKDIRHHMADEIDAKDRRIAELEAENEAWKRVDEGIREAHIAELVDENRRMQRELDREKEAYARLSEAFRERNDEAIRYQILAKEREQENRRLRQEGLKALAADRAVGNHTDTDHVLGLEAQVLRLRERVMHDNCECFSGWDPPDEHEKRCAGVMALEKVQEETSSEQ